MALGVCIWPGFVVVEMGVGIWTNSLGLITDGFHNIFDNLAIAIGLFAGISSKWKASRAAPFGYGV